MSLTGIADRKIGKLVQALLYKKPIADWSMGTSRPCNHTAACNLFSIVVDLAFETQCSGCQGMISIKLHTP